MREFDTLHLYTVWVAGETSLPTRFEVSVTRPESTSGFWQCLLITVHEHCGVTSENDDIFRVSRDHGIVGK
jgi:hypothetical protein